MDRMRRLRAEIAPNDSAQRLKDAGVDVYLGNARFVAPDQVAVGEATLTFARAVVATGGRPAVPEIAGLVETGYRTSDTIFELTALPRRLAVIGGGPIGCELAQAFRRFGSDVTLIATHARLLPRDDPSASTILAGQFTREGIAMRLGAMVASVASGPEGEQVRLADGETITVDEILVATGRTPNTDGLALDAAGVAFNRSGVTVDDLLRTSNPRVYAAGDVCSAWKFTHAADAHARLVIQNALFANRLFGRKRASSLVIPRVTYTDPEIAHVGMSADDAAAMGGRVTTFTADLAHNDRAILDGTAAGFARIHVGARSGRILGATLVAPHAGESIGELALAMTAKLSANDLTRTVHPYPTVADVWKRLGDQWSRTRLRPWIARLLARWLRWRR
jgi:pyruvate/2-oxoglutarate dehydrogenase complex dihydrolipoamide dehydrogenase (E3) component